MLPVITQEKDTTLYDNGIDARKYRDIVRKILGHVLLGRIAVPRSLRRCGLLLPTELRGLSVSLSVSVYHSSEPCKNGCTDRDVVWVEDSGESEEPLLDGVQIPP